MKYHWKYIVVALLIGLFLGAAFGRLSMHWFHHRGITGMMKDQGFNRMVNHFSSKLDLTPQQKEQVAVILKAKRDKVKALLSEMEPRFDDIRNSAAVEIRNLLTPEQQGKFDKFQAKHESRWKNSRLYHFVHDHP